MDNLTIYNKLRTPPADALRTIKGGRMNGKSDISPQWRIEVLTATFGACGFGWYYEVTKQWSEIGSDNQVSCFVNIHLFVKQGEEWSKPIFGTGGSSLVALEKSGLYTSDEGYKMATTDALGVAMKYLGVAADIYRNGEPSKYNKQEADNTAELVLAAETKAKESRAKLLELFADVSKLLELTEAQMGMEEAKAIALYLPSLAASKPLAKYFEK